VHEDYYRSALPRAVAYAATEHDGQLDLAREPYILHCLHVMAEQDTYYGMILGVLHDVVEDTSATVKDLQDEFCQEIAWGVSVLTKLKGEPYTDYIGRVEGATEEVVLVKIADLRHNMDATRLPSPLMSRGPWADRIEKYASALAGLERSLRIKS
jgi:(p)ppGpp synthase/HD superfamily hydrolase